MKKWEVFSGTNDQYNHDYRKFDSTMSATILFSAIDPETNAEINFYDEKEFQKWWEEEKLFLDKITSPNNSSQLRPILRQCKDSIESQYQNYFAPQNLHRKAEIAKNLNAELEKSFKSQKLPVFSSAEGKFLVDLGNRKEYGASIATAALSYLRNVPLVAYERGSVEGLIEGMKFKVLGGETATKSVVYDESFAKWSSLYPDLLKKGMDLKADAENLLSTKELEIKKVLESFYNKSENLLNGTEERLKKIESDYEKATAFKIPISYWSNVVRKQTAFAFSAILIFLVALALCLPWYKDLAQHLMNPSQAGQDVWRYIYMALLGTLIFWILRSIIRIATSCFHIAQEARHRATLIQTFLAMSSQKHIDPKDHLFLLSTIFAPVNTGLVAEDSIPHMPMEMATKTYPMKGP